MLAELISADPLLVAVRQCLWSKSYSCHDGAHDRLANVQQACLVHLRHHSSMLLAAQRCSDCRPGISLYYALELSFYGASTFMLAFWEERRRDYPVMMLHHVVSVFLIGASYVLGCAPRQLRAQKPELGHSYSRLQRRL